MKHLFFFVLFIVVSMGFMRFYQQLTKLDDLHPLIWFGFGYNFIAGIYVIKYAHKLTPLTHADPKIRNPVAQKMLGVMVSVFLVPVVIYFLPSTVAESVKGSPYTFFQLFLVCFGLGLAACFIDRGLLPPTPKEHT